MKYFSSQILQRMWDAGYRIILCVLYVVINILLHYAIRDVLVLGKSLIDHHKNRLYPLSVVKFVLKIKLKERFSYQYNVFDCL